MTSIKARDPLLGVKGGNRARGENYGVVLRQSYPPALSCSVGGLSLYYTQNPPLTLFSFVSCSVEKTFLETNIFVYFMGYILISL